MEEWGTLLYKRFAWWSGSVTHINVTLQVMLHSCYGWQTALDRCV